MGLWRDIKEDAACVFERDPAARSMIEVVTTYPGVHALIWHRIAHRLWRKDWRYGARFLSWLSRLLTNVDIHPGARIGHQFFIDHGAGVVIGETAIVGDGVTLYHGVTLGGTTWNKGQRHPTLEDNVVVGAGAKILGAIRIGCNSKVGANSVVVNHVPSGATVVGIPGRVVRKKNKIAYFNPHGIDLNHNLIPDPIDEAISCLLDRIRKLEEQVALQNDHTIFKEVCSDCGALSICTPNDENHAERAHG